MTLKFSIHILTGNVNSDTTKFTHAITFDPKNSGTANLFFSNINGNSLSKGNFIIVIQSPDKSQEPEISKSNSEIPQWIKNNADWWADGQIDDETFLQGVEFLIKQNILQVPATLSQESKSNSEIPQWIKNNADWWADGQIDDETFLQGIQFLIKNELLL